MSTPGTREGWAAGGSAAVSRRRSRAPVEARVLHRPRHPPCHFPGELELVGPAEIASRVGDDERAERGAGDAQRHHRSRSSGDASSFGGSRSCGVPCASAVATSGGASTAIDLPFDVRVGARVVGLGEERQGRALAGIQPRRPAEVIGGQPHDGRRGGLVVERARERPRGPGERVEPGARLALAPRRDRARSIAWAHCSPTARKNERSSSPKSVSGGYEAENPPMRHPAEHQRQAYERMVPLLAPADRGSGSDGRAPRCSRARSAGAH